MQRIAHISDVHVLEPAAQPLLERLAVRFLSTGRTVDPPMRRRNLLRAVRAAKDAGAGHLVISGDLTEMGTRPQFETFARALEEAGVNADDVTLVPGNHDAYTRGSAWKDALEGPLHAYRAASAEGHGKVVDRAEVVFLPLDVTCPQPITRSAGELSLEGAAALERRLSDPSFRDKTLVVVMHHPPFPHRQPAWQWVDGLRGWERLVPLLERYENVTVLHGHHHKEASRAVGGGAARVFGAAATVDDAEGEARVRVYDCGAGAGAPVVTAGEPLDALVAA